MKPIRVKYKNLLGFPATNRSDISPQVQVFMKKKARPETHPKNPLIAKPINKLMRGETQNYSSVTPSVWTSKKRKINLLYNFK